MKVILKTIAIAILTAATLTGCEDAEPKVTWSERIETRGDGTEVKVTEYFKGGEKTGETMEEWTEADGRSYIRRKTKRLTERGTYIVLLYERTEDTIRLTSTEYKR